MKWKLQSQHTKNSVLHCRKQCFQLLKLWCFTQCYTHFTLKITVWSEAECWKLQLWGWRKRHWIFLIIFINHKLKKGLRIVVCSRNIMRWGVKCLYSKCLLHQSSELLVQMYSWQVEKRRKWVFSYTNTLNKPTHSSDAVGEWETFRGKVDVGLWTCIKIAAIIKLSSCFLINTIKKKIKWTCQRFEVPYYSQWFVYGGCFLLN